MMRERVIDQASFIPGQTYPIELMFLYNKVAHSRIHIEVGTYCGRSLFVAAGAMKKGTIYIVDYPEPGGWGYQPAAWWNRSILDLTFKAISENFPGITLVPIWMDSISASHQLAQMGVSADSVFIDANHHEDFISQEIIAYTNLLREDGLLMGHDYCSAFMGVMNAVNTLVPDFRVEPNTRIWSARVNRKAQL